MSNFISEASVAAAVETQVNADATLEEVKTSFTVDPHGEKSVLPMKLVKARRNKVGEKRSSSISGKSLSEEICAITTLQDGGKTTAANMDKKKRITKQEQKLQDKGAQVHVAEDSSSANGSKSQ